MVRLEAGDIFAAENLDQDGYTLISCMTAKNPVMKVRRLVAQDELLDTLSGGRCIKALTADTGKPSRNRVCHEALGRRSAERTEEDAQKPQEGFPVVVI